MERNGSCLPKETLFCALAIGDPQPEVACELGTGKFTYFVNTHGSFREVMRSK